MVKVFISHQQADSAKAKEIADRLKYNHQIDTYLDVIDPNTRRSGEDLAEYIRNAMSTCNQLLAIVSVNTKASWWVPWEIGVATEKDQPIATFAIQNTELPEYLKKWPYLSTDHHLDEYARISKSTENTFTIKKSYLSESQARRSSTQDFYKTLRGSLGQPFAA